MTGPDLGNAIDAARLAAAKGWRTTLCRWNDPSETTEGMLQSYIAALQEIIRNKFDCYLSIKAPAFEYRTDVVRTVLDLAKTHGIRVHFDAQELVTVSRTLELLRELVKDYTNLSFTLPCRWERSLADAERLIEWQVPVRVVKGEFPGPEGDAFELERSYLRLVERLAGRAKHVAVATHRPALAARSLGQLIERGTSCELEQLYGLPLQAVNATAHLGVPVRIYLPYGETYLPYGISMMLRRPEVAYWIVRDLALGDRIRL